MFLAAFQLPCWHKGAGHPAPIATPNPPPPAPHRVGTAGRAGRSSKRGCRGTGNARQGTAARCTSTTMCSAEFFLCFDQWFCHFSNLCLVHTHQTSTRQKREQGSMLYPGNTVTFHGSPFPNDVKYQCAKHSSNKWCPQAHRQHSNKLVADTWPFQGHQKGRNRNEARCNAYLHSKLA